jgi:hypothetical protein
VPPLARELTTPPGGPPPAPAQSKAPHSVGEAVARTASRPCPLASVGALAEVLHPIGVAVSLVCAVVPQKSDCKSIRTQLRGRGGKRHGATYDGAHLRAGLGCLRRWHEACGEESREDYEGGEGHCPRGRTQVGRDAHSVGALIPPTQPRSRSWEAEASLAGTRAFGIIVKGASWASTIAFAGDRPW